jgi:hypothetical protein
MTFVTFGTSAAQAHVSASTCADASKIRAKGFGRRRSSGAEKEWLLCFFVLHEHYFTCKQEI